MGIAQDEFGDIDPAGHGGLPPLSKWHGEGCTGAHNSRRNFTFRSRTRVQSPLLRHPRECRLCGNAALPPHPPCPIKIRKQRAKASQIENCDGML
jgi:hypothetical protein